MLVSDFDFNLPEDLIAQHPPAVRGASRMLHLNRVTGAYEDRHFADLPQLLQPGDLLILNDSRVIPARLYATRAGLHTQHNSPTPTGLIEVLLTQPLGNDRWNALVKPAKKVQPGETLHFHAPDGATVLTASIESAGEFGERTLHFAPTPDFHAIVDRIGHLPLPPYIHREKNIPDTPEDRERYQTVFAHERGSAAAPTAGLHFTPAILEALKTRGVEIQYVTLHVGLGTFQPVRVDDTRDIRLHAEPYTLPAATAEALNRARADRRRILAVGTTTTRTLEHVARISTGDIAPHSGTTSLFLSPGLNDEFKLVQGLLTNFHLPQSTLIMLVSAFAGTDNTLRAYAHAVAQRYRFFSYGDCMLIT